MIFTPGEDPPGCSRRRRSLPTSTATTSPTVGPTRHGAALFYGTQRWASYVNVCAAVLAGQFVPGDGGEHYALNPSRALPRPTASPTSETRRPRGTIAPRRPSLLSRCDRGALIERDVVDPWRRTAASRIEGDLHGLARVGCRSMSRQLSTESRQPVCERPRERASA